MIRLIAGGEASPVFLAAVGSSGAVASCGGAFGDEHPGTYPDIHRVVVES